MLRQGTKAPKRKPRATATKPTAITNRESVPTGATLATSPTSGPVVAVSVCALVQLSFQMAVLRSSVKRAPGADVMTCGTVREKVITNIEATSESEMTCCVPGEGDAIGWGTVVNA